MSTTEQSRFDKPYHRHLRALRLRGMSGKGNCFDNSCAESFFHSLKIETIYGERSPTRQLSRQEVFEYIETFYNTTRQHSTLGYISPEVFEPGSVA